MEALIYLFIIILSSFIAICAVWLYKNYHSSDERNGASVSLSIIADNKNTSVDIGEMKNDFEDLANSGISIEYLIEKRK